MGASGISSEGAVLRDFHQSENATDVECARPRGITAADLQFKDFPPIKWIVDGYVVEGLTILAGKPKIGKSWLMLDIALAVARGGVALGCRECARGAVLYAALEDPERRLKDRLLKVHGASVRDSWPANLTFWTAGEMDRLDAGGLGQLRSWIADNPDAKLIIIDTLGMVRGSKRASETPYEADYRELGALKALADEIGVAITVVTHLRKQEADDSFDTVSGTLGLTGAADTTIILRRDSQGATLRAIGRDVEEIETAVTFERGLFRWRELGDAATMRRSDERTAILNALGEASEPMLPSDLASEIGKPGTATRKMLGKMVKTGEVVKHSRGKYALPVQDPGHNAHNGHNGSVVDALACDLVIDVTPPCGVDVGARLSHSNGQTSND